ncbi:hypothetical protein Pfo_017933 [Paulownia fortunei]|nr:hypothetical protein Pfo_017933 [Paulownia fortunei]
MALKTILIVLFVAIMATSIAEAQNPIGIVQFIMTHLCSLSAGATVQVACSADVIANAPVNATTNSNGVYLVVLIPRPNATVNSIVSNCRLFVLTPLSNCNPTLPSASLVSNLQFIKTVPNGFWYLTYMAAAGFTLQA